MGQELRQYQREAIDVCLAKLSEGVNRSIIVLPTGAGKTKTAVSLVEQGGFKRVLFCADAGELIEQSAMAFLAEKFDASLISHIEEVGFIEYVRGGGLFGLGEYKVGLIKADIFQPVGDIVVCSLQTLYRRLDRLTEDQFDLVIIDECHGATAKTWCQSIDFLKPRLLLGLTATPYRADGMPLGNVFDEIVYDYELGQAINDGWLCELDGVRVKTDVSLDKVKTTAGELNQKDLANEVNCYKRNKLVVDSYLKYAKGRQGIFFCVDIQHCLDLLEVFRDAGVNAAVVSSKEELTGDRSETIKLFKKERFDVLINVNIVTKGFNHPDTGVIGHVCPTKSLTKYMQATGRGTRKKSKKFVDRFGDNCIILDFVDSTSRHNLINTWSLEKGLPTEKKVFLTREKKDEIASRRNVKIEGDLRKKDEVVKLISIRDKPKTNSIRMVEMATEKQLEFIKSLGYDTVETVYTKKMVSEILDNLPATQESIRKLKSYNFDVSSPINRGQASYNIWMYEQKRLVK